ncbi:hypothetical protein B9Z55_007403 [Caenorhabditis nigoni]|uniref:Uncharacterized protein n=1 Tax=Caenorhabditis nigoni TaxID=1611254 RepID=A0A2G5V9L5_9PELO|nr:hypothetical protein B9Z55_007403 [Caenorhabditis nigoni]
MSVLLDLQKFIEAYFYCHKCPIYTDEKIVDVHDYLFNPKEAQIPQIVSRLNGRTGLRLYECFMLKQGATNYMGQWKNNEELRAIWLTKLNDFKAEQREQLNRGYIRIA